MLYGMLSFVMDAIDNLEVDGEPINSNVVSSMLRDGNSNMVKSVANNAPNDYVEGFTFPFRFQFATKQDDETYAMKICDEVVELFHQKQKSLNALSPPFKIVSSKCINLPSFADLDDENHYIYSCLFEFELEKV